MSSVTFTRPPIAPAVGAHDTMSSGANNDRGTTVRETGAPAPGGPSGPGKPPYRHIDDLVSVTVDLDPHTPLRKVLELGDTHMRQAITYSDFRRPDLALQEYIKAFTIAVDKVPKHKDYPSMNSDRGDLNRLYKALKTKITTNGATFDKIKEDIKENNRRSGVQPTISSKRPSEPTRLSCPGSSTAGLHKNGLGEEINTLNKVNVTHNTNDKIAGEHRPKPAVQPKPEALHGKAIKKNPSTQPEDLANRFARLRDAQKPRDVTKAASQVSAEAGKSTPSQALSSINTAIQTMPAMPKLPEAIYSPARGTVTSEIANLPSSTPRGMFSRTNSTASAPSVSARISTENAIRVFGREQFAAAHSYRTIQSSTSSTKVPIPDGDEITATALAELISGYPEIDVLVIDIRDRESFDEGHIKSAKTVCIEPEILMRENISADEIADSMVLAPPNERLAVEQRDKVDLVVIYDQDSTSIPSRITGDSLEMVLYNIRQALSYYSYSRPLKNAPKLLSGGLNSWVNEFGELSLETSDTISNSTSPSAALRRRYGDRRRSRTKTKTLSQNEINQFEDMIKNDRVGLDAFDYVKTREDFIRRYPSIRGEPESMISAGEDLDSQEDFLASIAPAPPRLPAPAIPRTRYSGLESRDVDSGVSGIAMAAAGTQITLKAVTGLVNNNNVCYCNSVLQALVASPGFIIDILQKEWPQNWRYPVNREPARGQLLCNMLKTLFMWLSKRVLTKIRAQGVMHYIRSIHEGYSHEGKVVRLGDENQHDADELITFVFDQIAAETDMSLHYRKTAENILIPINVGSVARLLVSHLLQQWSAVKAYNFVDLHFASLITHTRYCTNAACDYEASSSQVERSFAISPADDKTVHTRIGRTSSTLEHMMEGYFAPEELNITCSKCNRKDTIMRRGRLAKLPRLLRINVRRQATFDGSKDTTPVSFPFEIDLAPYIFDASTREQAAALLGKELGDGVAGTSQYDLYAVIVHLGRDANSGHYWSYVKDQRHDSWYHCNDAEVELLSGAKWHTALNRMYRCAGDATPVQLFYRRRDIPWVWDSNIDRFFQ
ncbi:hypothetical protein Daesc_002361 [Daldinia eschscholtzii]|uniref:Ubiquitin carboxyl-terminal hydrolase n=1 Tax=Daldinia eschscholtzii TaxID=292717 RepID=A0AAX6MX29_9PEZI